MIIKALELNIKSNQILRMRYFLFTLLFVVTLSSCGEYQKALKSEDIATKFAVGTELYEAGKYNKANRLFAQIVPNYRGKPQAEKLMFMYSNSFYLMKDYYVAAYQFERFESAYPKSEKAEEALFLSVKAYYQLSPVYSKEQKETVEAIEKIQLFINKYPESQYLDDANALMRELDHKLEKKAFEIAKLYNHVANYESADYEASIKAFDNFLLDFPGTELREDAMYYRLDSAYRLAINSVEHKKQVRLKKAAAFSESFIRVFPESKYNSEVQEMHNELKNATANYITKS